MAVTIFDVAERAGVSIGTVSRVLNQRDRVHPETRRRVMEAVKELDYQRNALASSLVTQRTQMIGMVVPMVNDPFFFEMVRGVEDAAYSANYTLIIASHPRSAKDRRYLDLFKRGYVDAMVLVASAEIQETEIRRAMDQGISVVLVQQEHEGIPSFVVDNYAGARALVEHLLGLGHRRIAYITGSDYTIDNAERFRGLYDVLSEHHLALPDSYIMQGDYHHGSGYEAMQKLLNLPEPPEAVFAANDQMAADAIQMARECGLRVPEDVAVVGFDDVSLARYTNPPLTTVAQPAYELGYEAATYALGQIGNTDPFVSFQKKLSTQLVIRLSCGAKKRL
ncbi:MAG: LacI family transcriptional regulator [Anaerolineae bacterium]|nr:LacI family transcriptional regulator [Anaerolineae bacterium]